MTLAGSKAFIGQPAPNFKTTAVVNGDFKEISLNQFKGKYVVLFFYPLDFTFVCPTEIIAFSDRISEFKKLDVAVMACSTDSHFSHLAWVNTDRKMGGLGQMNIPILADTNHAISKAYGVLKEDEGIAYRGLFIIDSKGILRQITVNDLPVGRSVDETLRLVQAFQFVDNHGEVCPANWQPGSETIKPEREMTLAGSKAFIGQPAPNFKTTAVVNGDFKEISLNQFKGKYVVLFFYPLDFTFVCPTEIIAFSDRISEFKKLDVAVMACSTDSHFSHLAWVNTDRKMGGLGQMNIPILADTNHAISKAYGVLKEDEGIAYRGLFIIDPEGILRQITVNDLPVGRSVDETLRLIQAFQFVDKHGEVCPANWQPGSDTIKPGVKESKAFFEKQ
uniref:thioredoxin-dependent peroxiredoxin n=2 Tax=Onchocerca TaxID=6281 RepID=A0A8R1Y5X9_ONCVO